MSSIIIDITREDSSSVDAELLLGLRGQTGTSAYEYAVMQGYSGSENDFSILMASYATVAEAAAESASESAQSAVESAQSADASESYASDAETSMNSASDYASAARASATSASQSAGVASGKADEAGESATSASNSADAAASSASSASTSASSASTSASNASASATAAAGSAASASADADRAEDAKEFLENASATATALPEGSSPSVTLSGGVFNFAIPKGDTGARGEKGDTGSKGDKGDTGDTGASAGFGTVSASVDDTVGTPSVEVTTSGTDTAKNFDFAFHNLKGDKGDKGDTGEVTTEQLDEATIVQTLSDNEPYHFRATPKCGSRQLDTIVGGSVGWNQLYNIANTGAETLNGVTFTKDSTSISAVGTASASVYKKLSDISNIANHKMLLVGSDKVVSGMTFYDDSVTRQFDGISTATIINCSGVAIRFKVRIDSGASVNAKFTPQVFDLTLMLGSTIADYVYSLEQSTSGSGVAWLKKYFDLDSYHPYDSGSIQSVSGLVSHDCVGFNAWDEEWEIGSYSSTGQKVPTSGGRIRSINKIQVLPNTPYYALKGVYILCQYDKNEDFISFTQLGVDSPSNTNHVFTTGEKTRYITFATHANYGTTYKNDICINISSDRNGEYEPYVKQSYPLDNTLTLRGIPKLSDGKMYYDGDVYESDGTVNRKYGIVDLGTLTYTHQALSGLRHGFSASISDLRETTGGTDLLPAVSSAYSAKRYNEDWGNGNMSYFYPTGRTVVFINNDYTDATAFKTAMNGVMLVYELATPTTETATPYTNPQLSYDGGTEEYVSTSIVPIGHETEYPMTFSDTMPTANGTYTMSVTITNGKPVISWTSSRSLSMTRTLSEETKTETELTKSELTKSDNIQLAEDIIEKGDKVDDISKEDAL